MNEPAAVLGSRLKAERERRGLSASKTADTLRLDAWVIDALEADDYERIGPAVFAKGHLKRYAALLELPAPEILAAYDSRLFVPNPPPPPPATVRLSTRAPAVSNLPWPRILGLSAAALFLLGILWWRPWHQRDRTPAVSTPVAESVTAPAAENPADLAAPVTLMPTAAPAGVTASAATAATAATAASAAATAATAAPVATSAPAATAPPIAASAPVTKPATPAAIGAATPTDAAARGAAAGSGRARLLLSFSADSWVDVHDAAGRRAFAGKGRANSVRVIRGAAPMQVYLGFASGVQLEINDRAVAIGRQFVSGNVARFVAGADGVLRRDPHGAAGSGSPSRNAHPPG